MQLVVLSTVTRFEENFNDLEGRDCRNINGGLKKVLMEVDAEIFSKLNWDHKECAGPEFKTNRKVLELVLLMAFNVWMRLTLFLC